MIQRKELTGADICILSSFLAWGIGCEFHKTPKSELHLNEAELQRLYDLIMSDWDHLLASNELEAARLKSVTIELSESNIHSLKSCVQAVLDECLGDPVELEVRVGNEHQVKSLLTKIFD